MPVYNEAAVIADVVGELGRDVVARLDGTEVVVVDDGSTDATPAVLDGLGEAHPWLTVIHAARNQGHGPSLRQAFESSAGEWILQMDSDGQQVPGELWDLWPLREEADLVVGVRRGRSEGRHRAAVSAFARMAARLAGGGRLRDVNVPFKLIRREVWEDLRGGIPARPVAPSLLIAVGASLRGWRVREVEISHLPRRAGRSTVDVPALVRLTAGALRELIRFRRRVGGGAAGAPPLGAGRGGGGAAVAFGAGRKHALVTCAACGAGDLRPGFRVAGEGGEFVPTTDRFGVALADFVRCSECGHLQLSAMPDVASLYEEAESGAYEAEEEGQRATARDVLERIERHARGWLLDYGCWVGFLASEAAGREWAVVGVEPSVWAAERARSRGVEVVDSPEGPFDAIAMGDVIEHLPDPGAVLDRLGALLLPGGGVWIATPRAARPRAAAA